MKIENLLFHSLMHIVYFLKDAEQWWSHSPVKWHFVRPIFHVEIMVDKPIVAFTIFECATLYDFVLAEMLALCADYRNGKYIHT